MFDDYDFLQYCEDKYLNGLGQDDAQEEIRNDTVRDSVRSQSTWQLVCWLGGYLQKENE